MATKEITENEKTELTSTKGTNGPNDVVCHTIFDWDDEQTSYLEDVFSSLIQYFRELGTNNDAGYNNDKKWDLSFYAKTSADIQLGFYFEDLMFKVSSRHLHSKNEYILSIEEYEVRDNLPRAFLDSRALIDYVKDIVDGKLIGQTNEYDESLAFAIDSFIDDIVKQNGYISSIIGGVSYASYHGFDIIYSLELNGGQSFKVKKVKSGYDLILTSLEGVTVTTTDGSMEQVLNDVRGIVNNANGCLK